MSEFDRLKELSEKYDSLKITEDEEDIEFDKNGFVEDHTKEITLHPIDLILLLKFSELTLQDEGITLKLQREGDGVEKMLETAVRDNGWIYASKKLAGKKVVIFVID